MASNHPVYMLEQQPLTHYLDLKSIYSPSKWGIGSNLKRYSEKTKTFEQLLLRVNYTS